MGWHQQNLLALEDVEALELCLNRPLMGRIWVKIKGMLCNEELIYLLPALGHYVLPYYHIIYYYLITLWVAMSIIMSDNWCNIIFHLIKVPDIMENNSSCCICSAGLEFFFLTRWFWNWVLQNFKIVWWAIFAYDWSAIKCIPELLRLLVMFLKLLLLYFLFAY